MGVVYNTAGIVTDGLVLALDAANSKSYPGSGTTWFDLSGNGYGNNLVGATTHSTNPSRFDTNATLTTELNHLSTSSQLTFNDGSEYTWDFYVKLRESASATYHSLLGRGSTSPWLSLYANNTNGTNWDIRYRQSDGTYINSSQITDYNIQNNWANITLSVASSRNVNIYLNGSFRQTINPTTTLFYINRIAGGYSSGGFYYAFQGSIAYFRVYNKALNSSEIQQNFNALRGRYGI
jgi:hypothetical protein